MSAVYFGPLLAVSPTDLQAMINGLNPVPGTCIFIDVCNSTLVKNQKPLTYWLPVIRNSIAIGQKLPSLMQPLKCIGDELMFYIPDSELVANNESHATLFESVENFISSWGPTLDGCILELKAAMHYCLDSYNLTFCGNIQNPVDDYYGSGVDLTARLMSKTKAKRLVISEDFYQKAQPTGAAYFINIKGPYLEDFKGFLSPTIYRYKQV